MSARLTLDVVLLHLAEGDPKIRWLTAIAAEVQEQLQARMPTVDWRVQAVTADPPQSSIPRRPRRAVAVLAQARSTLLAMDADVVLVLSEAPLLFRGHTVTSHTSPVQQTAALYLPPQSPSGDAGSVTLGAADTAQTPLAESIVRLLQQLVGLDTDPDDDIESVLRAMGAANTTSLWHSRARRDSHPHDSQTGHGVRDRLRAVNDMVRLVTAQVAAARPWLLALHLSRTLLGASAAALVAVVTPDFWLLADRMGPSRLTVVLACVLASGVCVLAIGGGLLERQPQIPRRDVRVHNAAIWVSVSIGVLTLFAGIVAVNLIATTVVLPRDLVAETVGHTASWQTMAQICALTAGVSLVGSVLGAGLEDDAVVQDAAFGNSDDAEYTGDPSHQ